MTSLILLVVSNLVFYALIVGLAWYWFVRKRPSQPPESRPDIPAQEQRFDMGDLMNRLDDFIGRRE
jgi:hypothetical protein